MGNCGYNDACSYNYAHIDAATKLNRYRHRRQKNHHDHDDHDHEHCHHVASLTTLNEDLLYIILEYGVTSAQTLINLKHCDRVLNAILTKETYENNSTKQMQSTIHPTLNRIWKRILLAQWPNFLIDSSSSNTEHLHMHENKQLRYDLFFKIRFMSLKKYNRDTIQSLPKITLKSYHHVGKKYEQLLEYELNVQKMRHMNIIDQHPFIEGCSIQWNDYLKISKNYNYNNNNNNNNNNDDNSINGIDEDSKDDNINNGARNNNDNYKIQEIGDIEDIGLILAGKKTNRHDKRGNAFTKSAKNMVASILGKNNFAIQFRCPLFWSEIDDINGNTNVNQVVLHDNDNNSPLSVTVTVPDDKISTMKSIKMCQVCKKNVYFVKNKLDLERKIDNGDCVSFNVQQVFGKDFNFDFWKNGPPFMDNNYSDGNDSYNYNENTSLVRSGMVQGMLVQQPTTSTDPYGLNINSSAPEPSIDHSGPLIGNYNNNNNNNVNIEDRSVDHGNGYNQSDYFKYDQPMKMQQVQPYHHIATPMPPATPMDSDSNDSSDDNNIHKYT